MVPVSRLLRDPPLHNARGARGVLAHMQDIPPGAHAGASHSRPRTSRLSTCRPGRRWGTFRYGTPSLAPGGILQLSTPQFLPLFLGRVFGPSVFSLRFAGLNPAGFRCSISLSVSTLSALYHPCGHPPPPRPADEGDALPSSLGLRPRLVLVPLPALATCNPLSDDVGRPRLLLATNLRPPSMLGSSAAAPSVAETVLVSVRGFPVVPFV